MSKQNNNGGPAFPLFIPANDNNFENVENGMTLRDYFVAAAIQGLLAKHGGGFRELPEAAGHIVEEAFYIAEILLNEREKR